MKRSQEYEHWGKTAIDFSKLTYMGGLLFAITYWLTTKDFSLVKFAILSSSSLITVVVLLFAAKKSFQKSVDEENENG